MMQVLKQMLSPNEFLQQIDDDVDEEAKERASLRLAAMNILAMREHSRYELEVKLAKKSEDAGMISVVLDKLATENLQDDRRFAVSFIQSKANNGFGPYRIKQELNQKRVSDALVGEALAELAIDWWDVAKTVYGKRIARLKVIDAKEKQKQSRYLHSRGFSGEIVHSVIGSN